MASSFADWSMRSACEAQSHGSPRTVRVDSQTPRPNSSPSSAGSMRKPANSVS